MAQTKIQCEFFEINTKTTFMKAKMDAAKIGKVKLSFVQFDDSKEKGSKIVSNGDFYLSFADAKLIANDILSGKIAKMAKIEKDKGAAYPGAIWKAQGGIKEEKCAEKQYRKDGKAIAKVLSLSPGSRQPFIFTLEQGMGESNAQGLIVPKWGTKPEVQIRVACDGDTLKKFALMVNTYVDGFVASQFARGAYEVEIKGVAA